MDKSLAKYLIGEARAIKLEVVLSQEVLPNGARHIRILHDDKLIHQFWEKAHQNGQKTAEPRHIGGRKPYIMLMIEEIQKLREQKVTNIEELMGFLVCLSGNIEWKTGRLVKKRSKKPFQYEDLVGMYSRGRGALRRILADLKKYDLLSHTKEGYFVSNRLIKRGRVKTD